MELPARYGQTETKAKSRKYKNTPTEYMGYKYDSKAEAKLAEQLDMLKRGHVIKDWNQQVSLSFDVDTEGRLICKSKSVYLPQPDKEIRVQHHICRYVVDFLIIHDDNTVELVEVKGGKATQTRAWKYKRAMLEATMLFKHPEIKYRVAT